MVGGRLYVVATPIGNLGDLSPRAISTLSTVSFVAAEDTRQTRRLLAANDIHTPLVSFHSHSSPQRVEEVLHRVQAGESAALVTDAGTPGISDPGGELVRAAVDLGIRVVPIPGASAPICALSASGLDPSRFLFHGFLPRKSGDRRKALQQLASLPHTLIFFEAANRLDETLRDLAAVLGNRQSVVARELTKYFEEFVRGSLEELETWAREKPPRGECVVLVAGNPVEPPIAEAANQTEALLDLLEQGLSVRDASRRLSETTGIPRRELYELATRLRNDQEATNGATAEQP